MVVHEFGDRSNPVIMLFPGTWCYWKANFGGVIEGLQQSFCVAAVSYSGFDEAEEAEFTSMIDETEKIENYVKEHYNGSIHAAYGCSLGGSFVGILVSRKNIHINHGIIGSSDLDQSGKLAAKIQCAVMLPIVYPLITTGHFRSNFLNKYMQKKIAEMGVYGEKFMAMFGIGEYDLSFISKTSAQNQFYSDMITPLPEKIKVDGTAIHVFYALKMGEKYLARYKKHFDHPDIIRQDMEHEELLAVYPEKWVELVRRVCELS